MIHLFKSRKIIRATEIHRQYVKVYEEGVMIETNMGVMVLVINKKKGKQVCIMKQYTHTRL